MKGHGPEFRYKADWTNHDRSVAGLPGLQVLLRVDEQSYTLVRPCFQQRGGKAMGEAHPVAWICSWGRRRVFYSELAHSLSSLETPFR
ncbi:MAG: ThuA domain-containing protein [Verrucomicrobiota bacterium]|nr:ThuA domain-containing protein [Verrucomicrobiota bacterium]